MKNQSKTKILITLSYLIFILPFLYIGAINYTADPLWLFNYDNKYNTKQLDFDERQQKTNYLYFKSNKDFDGILLGSSRATFVDQNEFKNMNIFNYSANAMSPIEYKDYLDFAKKVKGEDLKYIIIGLDFEGSGISKNSQFEKPNFYIDKTTTFLYRYKMLFSLDLYKKSKEQLENYKTYEKYYNRENIKFQNKVSEEERQLRYSGTLKTHIKNLLYPNYEYNNNYINILKTIKNENPNSKFIIYTSAVTAGLFLATIKEADKWQEYKNWLHQSVEVFGEINHFMTISTITKNLQNYPDDDHAYPDVLKLLANKLSNFENKDIPKDFGVKLTKDNIDKYLEDLEKQIYSQ
ncbi:hypothetical protein [Aliarcobacter cryaerophilus]|uniref:Uncharacterized protein n=1 Tax=Aliarcobacter cryaerophilus TaxID=28198 RepID=A0A2S9SPY6_9BACT|nr:hypothetical protein [Aliarcobacter cryaerophilus]MCT7506319.1 hypothetical protein [Aliarcobacter cryaerophilus]PRM88653.1 hypothetical protein CJ669_03210 [Aliarcobacter cryaerophilus]